MEIFLIVFVVFGVIVNFIMVNTKIRNEVRVLDSKDKQLLNQIRLLRKFVNMPEPINPSEEE